MSVSSKISRKGISPLDVDLGKSVLNIKRRVLFTVDQPLPVSSGAISANAITASSTSPSPSPTNSFPGPSLPIAKNTSLRFPSSSSPSKASPPLVEILFNPHNNKLCSSFSADVSELDAQCSHSTDGEDPFEFLVHKVTEGLRYYAPELCDEGENGTYFLRDKFGKRIAVFKSADEEGVSSPKRKNTLPNPEDDEYFKQFHLEIAGENDQSSSDPPSNMEQLITDCVKNEVASYLLDLQAHGFYSVPQTGLVAIHPLLQAPGKKNNDGNYFTSSKVGSLQTFIESDGTASDVGPVLFSVREVHKIGILDIQILNLDRHLGNILIKKSQSSPAPLPRLSLGDSPFRNKALSGVPLPSGQGPSTSGTSLPNSWPRHKPSYGEYALTPIDHGYSLPSSFASVRDLWFEWITFPQAKRPFDEETRQFIQSIDIVDNARLLQQLGISEESIRIMEITTTLLKKCAAANWTLYDIAMLIVNCSIREGEEPSALEDLFAEAEEDYEAMLSSSDFASNDTALFLSLVAQKVDDLIEQHQQMLLKQQQFERK